MKRSNLDPESSVSQTSAGVSYWLRIAEISAEKIKPNDKRALRLSRLAEVYASSQIFADCERILRMLRSLVRAHSARYAGSVSRDAIAESYAKAGRKAPALLQDLPDRRPPQPPILISSVGSAESTLESALKAAESRASNKKDATRRAARAEKLLEKHEKEISTHDIQQFRRRLVGLYAELKNPRSALRIAKQIDFFPKLERARLEFSAGAMRAYRSTVKSILEPAYPHGFLNFHHTISNICDLARLQVRLEQYNDCANTYRRAASLLADAEKSALCQPAVLGMACAEFAVLMHELEAMKSADAYIRRAEQWAGYHRGSKDLKTSLWLSLAEAYSRMSDYLSAVRCAKRIPAPDAQLKTLETLAAETTDLNQLRAMFSKIKTAEEKCDVATRIARAVQLHDGASADAPE